MGENPQGKSRRPALVLPESIRHLPGCHGITWTDAEIESFSGWLLPHYLGIGYWFIGHQQNAQDAVMDFFVHLRHLVERYDPREQEQIVKSPVRYLDSCFFHHLSKQRRVLVMRQQREVPMLMDSDGRYIIDFVGDVGVPEAERHEVEELLGRALNGLEPAQRQALALRSQGLSDAEIAPLMDRSTEAIKQLRLRARQKLREVEELRPYLEMWSCAGPLHPKPQPAGQPKSEEDNR
jgi:RNA polymerase sigma factor (sigma-70 family)